MIPSSNKIGTSIIGDGVDIALSRPLFTQKSESTIDITIPDEIADGLIEEFYDE